MILPFFQPFFTKFFLNSLPPSPGPGTMEYLYSIPPR